MKSLQQIGLEKNTDKAHTHFYMDNYEAHLKEFRDKEFVMWEFGVAAACSLNMWREAFPQAKIFGIDINPDCAQYEGVFIGSQTDLDFLNSLIEKTGAPDVIVDDGSHFGPDMIATFKHIFPKMNQGGHYYIEDLHCLYDPTYGPAPPYGQGMSEAYTFFTNLAIDVDCYGRHMTGDSRYAIETPKDIPPVPEFSRILKSIHIYPSLRLFVRK